MKRSTCFFSAAAGFKSFTIIALAASVASRLGSRLGGGCRHVVESLNIEHEESTE